MELLLALPAGRPAPAERFGMICAHMAYRVGAGPRLLGIRLPDGLRGGMMLLDCDGFDGAGDPGPCCSQILGECRRRQYRGIVCDFEGPPTGCVGQLLTTLDQGCAKEGWALHVPESCAGFAPSARVLISSALTTGTLERRLRSAMERWGPTRPALAVEWLREDLLLPAEGRGDPMTQAALDDQLHRLEPAVFFDRGLCAHYYTYMARSGQAHFVLFDTPRSVRAKLALARQLGLPAALLAAPEVDSFLPAILE